MENGIYEASGIREIDFLLAVSPGRELCHVRLRSPKSGGKSTKRLFVTCTTTMGPYEGYIINVKLAKGN